ncbi:unnamed protein product [Caenorhabditis angaria]|uniref:EGF-like domain-containing protein n=1 Tax=Caenorhabditis angaria TaxID=860376 RepID=A0A9P1J1Z0_9PELO|nr:unnamed protein product [Caenorhabditis angaria]
MFFSLKAVAHFFGILMANPMIDYGNATIAVTEQMSQIKSGLENRTGSTYPILLEKTASFILDSPEYVIENEIARNKTLIPNKQNRIQLFLDFYRTEPDYYLTLDLQVRLRLLNATDLTKVQMYQLKMHESVLETAMQVSYLQVVLDTASTANLTILAKNSTGLLKITLNPETLVEKAENINFWIGENSNLLLAKNSRDSITYFLKDATIFEVDLKKEKVEIREIGKVEEDDVISMDFDFEMDLIYLSKTSRLHNHGHLDACQLKNISYCTTVIIDRVEHVFLNPNFGTMIWQNSTSNLIFSTMSGEDQRSIKIQEKSIIHSMILDGEKSIFYLETSETSRQVWKLENPEDSPKEILNSFEISKFQISGEFMIYLSGFQDDLWICKIERCAETSWRTGFRNLEDFTVIQEDASEVRGTPECSDFQLKSGKSAISCRCQTGHSKISDKSCAKTIQTILYLSSVDGILWTSLDTSELILSPLKFTGNKTEVIDLNPVTGNLYWLENDAMSIAKNLRSINTTLFTLPYAVSKFRYDSKTHSVFWLEDGARIGVSSLITGFSKSIIFPLENAQSFVIDENDRTILVLMRKNEIWKFSMFGEEKRRVYKSEDENVEISDLVIKGDRIVWLEDQVMVMDMRTHKITKFKINLPPNFSQPSSIDISSNNEIFMSFLVVKTIVKFSLDNLEIQNIEAPSFGSIGIKIWESEAESNLRFDENCKKCEHVCLSVNSVRVTCDCTDGFFMDPKSQKCIEKSDLVYFLDSKNRIFYKSLDFIEVGSHQMHISNYFKIFEKIETFDVTDKFLVLAGKSRAKPGIGILAKIDISQNHQKNRFFVNSIPKLEIILEDSSIFGISDLKIHFGNVFWTNILTNQMEIVDLEGKFRKILIWEEFQPRNFVIDEENVIFYERDIIQTLSLETMQVIPTHYDIRNLTDISISTSQKSIIWLRNPQEYTVITVGSIDGFSQEILYSGNDWRPISAIFGAEIFGEDEIFIFETSGRAGKYDGSYFQEFSTGLKDLKLAKLQKSQKTAAKYGRCDQLRLTPIICACQNHDILERRNGRCLDGPNRIVAAGTSGFYETRILEDQERDQDQEQKLDVILKILDFESGESRGSDFQIQDFAVNFYPHQKLIFWIEKNHLGTIKSVQYPGAPQIHETSAKSTSLCDKFHSLALDPIGNQLFVTCYRDQIGYLILYRINWASYAKLKFVAILVSGGAFETVTGMPLQPMDLVVMPKFGLLFYVDGNSHIIKCTYDCKKCSIWSNIYSETKIQAHQNNIFVTNSSGTWARNFETGKIENFWNFEGISDIAPINEQIILASDGNRTFFLPGNETVEKLENVGGFFRQDNYEIPNLCHNLQCSHICTVSNGKPKCLCPIGKELSSFSDSQCLPTIICEPWQFTCTNGKQCIHSAKKCDKINDCSDHSDESFDLCPKIDNSIDNWPCDDLSGFVSRKNLCDGISNCPDSSDELHCRCERPHEFFDCAASYRNLNAQLLAPNFKCIHRSKICDSKNDCGNYEDEFACGEHQKKPAEIKWLYVILAALLIFILILLALAICVAVKENQSSKARAPEFSTQQTTVFPQEFYYAKIERQPMPCQISRSDRIRRRQSFAMSEMSDPPRSSTPFQEDFKRPPSISLTPIFKDI